MISIVIVLGTIALALLEREPRTPDQKYIDSMAHRDRRRSR